jgi:hypothetical protein
MFRVFPDSRSAPLAVTAHTDSPAQKLPALIGGPADARRGDGAELRLGEFQVSEPDQM